MRGKDVLKRLSSVEAVSGSERNLHETLSELFSDVTDEYITGKLDDFCAIKRGEGNGSLKIMIAAHGDEIGLMVKSIDERGFVHFVKVTGVDVKTLPAQEVTIHGKEEVFGVIGAKPPHVLSDEERKEAIKIEDMTIDTGFTREELLNKIQIGDYATVNRKPVDLLGDFMTGRAFDNRCGVAAMLECAEELKKLRHTADVYFTCTSFEEAGHMGARTMAYSINPDIAIATDVDFGDKCYNEYVTKETGKGLSITVGPNIHPELGQRLMDIADEYNIPYGIDVSAGSTGTDAWDIQVVREGIPSVLVSVPIKYMHTPTEVASYKDVERAGKLMALFIASIKDRGDINAQLA